MTNDPYHGGSHLPDVTVITPVHDAAGQLRFFTASRAHHAEIGGIAPGSMPPGSRNLAEEGVVIRNFHLVHCRRAALGRAGRVARRRGPIPAGTSPTNLADIAAQVAANRRGARDLDALVERYSWPVVSAYMEHIQHAAAEKVSRGTGPLSDPARAASSTIWTTARRSPSRSIWPAAGPCSILPEPGRCCRAI